MYFVNQVETTFPFPQPGTETESCVSPNLLPQLGEMK